MARSQRNERKKAPPGSRGETKARVEFSFLKSVFFDDGMKTRESSDHLADRRDGDRASEKEPAATRESF